MRKIEEVTDLKDKPVDAAEYKAFSRYNNIIS